MGPWWPWQPPGVSPETGISTCAGTAKHTEDKPNVSIRINARIATGRELSISLYSYDATPVVLDTQVVNERKNDMKCPAIYANAHWLVLVTVVTARAILSRFNRPKDVRYFDRSVRVVPFICRAAAVSRLANQGSPIIRSSLSS